MCDPVLIQVFRPKDLTEGVFLTPDRLTFIEEGEHFPVTPYLIYNPVAGKTHYMDRAEFQFAKFLVNGRTLGEIQEFHARALVPQSPNGGSESNLLESFLKPMLLANLVVMVDPQWRKETGVGNIYVSHEPIQGYRITPRGFPESIALSPTGRCDNFCRHCSVLANEPELRQDRLSLPVLRGLLDEMHRNGLKMLRITGGEPFMREDIFDILEYAATKHFTILFFTNGNRITESSIDRLAAVATEKGQDFLLHLSLDGGPEGHDWFRRAPGAYDRVLRAMRLFREKGIPYFIEMNCHPKMFHEFEQAVETAVSLDCRAVLAHPPLALGRGMSHVSEIHVTFAQARDLWQRTRSLKERLKGYDLRFSSYELPSAALRGDSQGNEPAQECAGSAETDTQATPRPIPRTCQGHCTAGKSQLSISPKGGVYPCPNCEGSDMEPMGDVLSDSISAIWRAPEAWGTTRGDWDYDDIAVCRSCQYLKGCELGKLCRLPSLAWFGTPFGPPPSCLLYHRELGLDPAAVKDFLLSVRGSTRKGFPADRILAEADAGR
jgi:radical SAM protein with 4Fe4S-binding SPASM domain